MEKIRVRVGLVMVLGNKDKLKHKKSRSLLSQKDATKKGRIFVSREK